MGRRLPTCIATGIAPTAIRWLAAIGWAAYHTVHLVVRASTSSCTWTWRTRVARSHYVRTCFLSHARRIRPQHVPTTGNLERVIQIPDRMPLSDAQKRYTTYPATDQPPTSGHEKADLPPLRLVSSVINHQTPRHSSTSLMPRWVHSLIGSFPTRRFP